MKRWLKRIWRFWPGLLALVLTSIALAWLMQPQPRTVHKVKLPPPPPEALGPGWAIYSPCGRFIGVVYQHSSPYESQTLRVCDRRSGQELHTVTIQGVIQPLFDEHGALYYFEQEQLRRWDPATGHTQKFLEIDLSCRIEKGFVVFDSDRRGGSTDCHSILSPTGRWWVIPRANDDSLWYERVNVRTGKSEGRINLPVKKLGSESSSQERVVGMFFTREGDTLVAETQRGDESNRQCRLYWIDMKSGRVLHTACPKTRLEAASTLTDHGRCSPIR